MVSLDILIKSIENLDNIIIKSKLSDLILEPINIPGIQRLKNNSKIDEIISHQLDFFKKHLKWNFIGY